MTVDKAYELLCRVPVCFDWVKFKGEEVVVSWNVEATMKAGRPMVNIHYCMTKAFNGIVLKIARWDKRFSPSKNGTQF